MPKLTKRVAERIKPNVAEAKDVVVWDNELRGFGVRVKASGVRSYIIQYRNRHHRSRRLTIGRHGVLTTEQARIEARRLLVDVARGEDPAQIRREDRDIETFAEFADRYFADYVPARKKASTIAVDRANLTNHLLPTFTTLPLAGITRADVVRWYQGMKAWPGAANRTLSLLSHMMNVAEQWGLRPDASNPCRHVEKYTTKKRERFLSRAELARLGEVLREAERSGSERESVIAAILLLIFTGCRRGEIQNLRWEHVDFDGECLRLADSKTGPKVVYLNAPSLAVLGKLLGGRDQRGWVIEGAKPGRPLVNLKKPWGRIRKAAGIEDVRIHDLRHSFASVGVAGGLSLPIIGALLGHSQPGTTARYAHLADDPLRQASETIAHQIVAALAPATPDDGAPDRDDNVIALAATPACEAALLDEAAVAYTLQRDAKGKYDGGRFGTWVALHVAMEALEQKGANSSQMKALNRLASALSDLDSGTVAALFVPTRRRKGGAMPVPFERELLKALSVAAVDLLMKAGMKERDACAHVASELSKKGYLVSKRTDTDWAGAVMNWRKNIDLNRVKERRDNILRDLGRREGTPLAKAEKLLSQLTGIVPVPSFVIESKDEEEGVPEAPGKHATGQRRDDFG